jgi:hypothetical protein
MRLALNDLKIVLVLACVSAGSTATCAQEIGTAAAVNPSAQARGQGGARTIIIGQSIAHRERIQTTAAGSVQLLFVDKTSMTIGPNSDLAIDEYVFDPKANTGRLSATLAKGLVRFVGGQVSHTGTAEITTPNGLVGIRGGVGIIGTHQVFIGFGRGTVTAGSSQVTLDPGEYTQILNGLPPTPPTLPPAGWLRQALANFQSQGSQGGGAPASGNAVANARTTVTGSQSGAVVTTTFSNGEGERRPPPTLSTQSVSQSVSQTVTQTTAVNTVPPPVPPPTPQQPSTPTAGPPAPTSPNPAPPAPPLPQPPAPGPTGGPPAPGPTGGPPAPNPPPPQYGGPAFTFTMGNCCGQSSAGSTAAPYLPSSFTTGTNTFISQGMGYDPSASPQGGGNAVRTNGATGSQPRPVFFQWGIGMTGSGANQSSWLSVATGTLEGTGDDLTFSGGFGATRRGSGNQSLGRAHGSFSSTAGSVTVDEQGLPLTATINQQSYNSITQRYRDIQAQYSLGGTSPLSGYTFTQQVTRTAAPPGFGTYRPEAVLTGWTGGLMQTFSRSSASSPVATVGVAEVILDPTRARVQATFDVANVSSPFSSFQGGTFRMGSVNPSQPGQSAYVDYENFAAREAVSVGRSGRHERQLTTVNERRVRSSNTFMVNVPRDVATRLMPNTTICQCDYTRWGFWSTDTERSGPDGTRSDRGHMMTWVAGQLPNKGEIPQSGTATYTGHVVANVSNNGAQYIASGNLTNTVNFGTRSGTAQVSGFDGATYRGLLGLDREDPRFLSAILGSTAGRAMFMNGSFFRGSQGPVGEMGGNVTVFGRNYLGSGIFVGRAN